MAGRCSGCGKTGAPARLRRHCAECPQWQAQFAADPATALDPEAAWWQWSAEGKRAESAQRREDATGREDVQLTAAAIRWAVPKDILED